MTMKRSRGRLKEMSDHVLHVKVSNYGIVEDIHQACVHLVTQFLKEVWEGAKR